MQDESRGLPENYLREQDGLATCNLTVTELHRVGGWYDLDAGAVQDVHRFDRIPLTAALLRQAGLLPHLPGTYRRSLDALHIVAALDTSQAAFMTA